MFRTFGESPNSFYRELLRKLEKGNDLKEILKETEKYCSDCKPPSPMFCLSCNLWKVKNDYVKLRENLRDENYPIKLFNALKLKRRIKVANHAYKSSLTPQRAQSLFKKSSYSTRPDKLIKYLFEPLERVGILAKEGNAYRTTFYGKRILDILNSCKNFPDVFKYSPVCYEEFYLVELLSGPKTPRELAKLSLGKNKIKAGDHVWDFIRKLRKKELVEKEDSRVYLTLKGEEMAKCIKRMLEVRDKLLTLDDS